MRRRTLLPILLALVLAWLIWAGQGPGKAPDPSLPHHGRRGFLNNYPHETHGLGGLLEWAWQRRKVEVERVEFPHVKPDADQLRLNRTRPTLTWIGHATFLLQIDGVNILTDPHFSDRASPVSWTGPRRTTPPSLPLAELPPIDIVLISHNHYDHMDAPTLRELYRRQQQHPPTFYVPLANRPTLRKMGIEERHVKELDWWQSDRFAQLSVHAVPAQHFSARGGFDRFRALWAGWIVERKGFRFFFAGDTGYSPDFADIRERIGPVDLAAIPIGAYEPRWFMRSMHLNPEEAVRVHFDLESRYSVGMHWGTFVLTDEPMDEPPRRLAAAREAAGVDADRFFVMRHGETRDLQFLLRDEAQ